MVRGVRASSEHLTEYQHLLGESASDQLPAGFVHVLAFPVATALMARSDFPLPLVGLVHVANRVTQLRPLSLSDALDVRASAADLRAAPVRHAGRPGHRGDRRRHARVARGLDVSRARASSWPGLRQPTTTPPTFVPPTPTGRWTLDGDIGRRYAAVSGDRNPIHLSALSAKALGFPRAIAHGMYTASRALADVGAAAATRSTGPSSS